MIKIIFIFLIITNISFVISCFSEYLSSLLLLKNKVEAEIVGFEQKRNEGGRGVRSNFYSLICFKIDNIPHVVLIGRDRKDSVGKRINICYDEKKNVVMRNAVRKTYYLGSRMVQILYLFILLFFFTIDLVVQIICFYTIEPKSYILWTIIAFFSAILSFILSRAYMVWQYKQLNI